MSDGTWSNLVSGLAGSIIGGLISLATSLWTIKCQNNHNKQLEDMNLKYSLSAIRSELGTVYERYTRQMGRFLENYSADQCPFVVFPIQEDYFPIYKNNTPSVGKIKSDEIRNQVIKAYTLATAMIDSVRMNNVLVEEIDQSKIQGQREQAIREARIYWEQLRMEHCHLREAVNLANKGLGIEIESLHI